MEQLPEAQVKQEIIQFIREHVGKAFNVTVPSPEYFLRYCLMYFHFIQCRGDEY
jgi:hypothetical protein